MRNVILTHNHGRYRNGRYWQDTTDSMVAFAIIPSSTFIDHNFLSSSRTIHLSMISIDATDIPQESIQYLGGIVLQNKTHEAAVMVRLSFRNSSCQLVIAG